MWRDAALVAERDLRIELRSRVALSQIAPFALVVLIMFGIALDADKGLLERVTPGLYWMTVLFSSLLAITRSGSLEQGVGTRDALRLSALDPAGVFLGKVGAVGVQILLLQAVLAAGVAILYGTSFGSLALVTLTCLAVTAALAAAGSLYESLVTGVSMRHTLLPLLLLPVMAPVLIGATRAFEDALGDSLANGWAWCGFVAGIALLYLIVGAMSYGTMLEDA
jgi:heme exporter protein B